MIDPNLCPECGSNNTEQVNTDHWIEEIVITRICNECPTQYDLSYGDPYKKNVLKLDE